MPDEREDAATELQRALRQQEEQISFTLDVAEGPDKGLARVLEPSEPLELLVGQSPACGLQLTDATVSRRHASMDIAGSRLRVRDLGSTNGTTVDGVEIAEAFLRGGERVRLGNTTIVVASGAAKSSAAAQATFGSLVTSSRAMRRLVPLLARIATSSVPVLIEGETGTGKEVIARAIHDESGRRAAPFVVFDCSAVASSVIESELFGHERGAFTGAVGARKGVFEQAHGGTLFIDELGELPLDLQPRLLRALERSEVRRVGGNDWIKCDVRVIAATRRDMDAYVLEGRFRDDLFHRLAVGRVALPPLRRRQEDIAPLVERFAREVDPEAPPIASRVIEEWRRNAWPGNVRELRNAVFRHLALGDAADLAADEGDDSPAPVQSQGESELDAILRLQLPFKKARAMMLRAFEHRYIEQTVASAGGNVQRAANAAGLALRYFQLLRALRK
jgi:DNA-binding NtrC family response regulator